MRLTERAHDIVRRCVAPGETVIDATAGNGHDTCFLSECVGESGIVFAFDVQLAALAATAERLKQRRLSPARLLQRDHAELAASLPPESRRNVAAVMFNLGYLPGGDKAVMTRTESTLTALDAALSVLRGGGVLTILAYPGHPGGDSEAESVEQFIAALPDAAFEVAIFGADSDAVTAPRLLVVWKR